MADIIPPRRHTLLRSVEGRIASFFEAVARLSTLEGEGSPEGVVDGGVTRQYWDTTNNTMYVKSTGNGLKTGWIAQ